MPTCKDCLHIDACKNAIRELFPMYNIIDEFGDYKVNNCKSFVSSKEYAIMRREK